MNDSPRLRRLQRDFEELQQLISETTILKAWAKRPYANSPPDRYRLEFHGRGIESVHGASIVTREVHDIQVTLGPDYPRLQPELQWRTPIFHPNVAANGSVCLGALHWHWTPSMSLVDLCRMLWDMIRYANFDWQSPLNFAAANWVKSQPAAMFPLDTRPLRDRVASQPEDRLSVRMGAGGPRVVPPAVPPRTAVPPPLPAHQSNATGDVLIID